MNEAKVVPNREISMYYTAGVNLIREQRDEARAIARKLYAENKRLKADNERLYLFMEVYNNKIAPWINNAAEVLYILGRSIHD